MSSMAFAMYQFTKGEGRLNTTQDLFTQAEYFAEEANRLYKIVRQFSYQVKSHIYIHTFISNTSHIYFRIVRLLIICNRTKYIIIF